MPKQPTAKQDAATKLLDINGKLHEIMATLEVEKVVDEGIAVIPVDPIKASFTLASDAINIAGNIGLHGELLDDLVKLCSVVQKVLETYEETNGKITIPAEVASDLSMVIINLIANKIHDMAMNLIGATGQIQACSATKVDPEEAATVAKYCSGVLPKISQATVAKVPLAHKVFNGQKVVQHYPTNIIHKLGLHKVEVSTHTAGENPSVAIEYHDSSAHYPDSKNRMKGVTERLKKEGLLCFPQYPNLYCSGEFDKSKLTQLAAFFSLLLNADVGSMGAETVPVVSDATWELAGDLALKNGDDTWKSGQGQLNWGFMKSKWLQDKEIMTKSKIYGDLKQLAIHRDQHHELEEAMGVDFGKHASPKAVKDITANGEKAVALCKKNNWGGQLTSQMQSSINNFKKTGSGNQSDAIGNILHNILIDELQKLGEYGNCPTGAHLPDVNAGSLSYCEGTLKGTTTILEGGGSQPLHKVAPKQYKTIIIDENPEGGYDLHIPIATGFWSKELASYLEGKFGFNCKSQSYGSWKAGSVCNVHVDSHDKIRLLAIFLSNLKGGSEAIGEECAPIAMEEAWNYAQGQAKKGTMAFTQEPIVSTPKQWIDKCFKTYGIMPPGLTEEQKVMLELIGPDKTYAGCDLSAEDSVPNTGIIRYCEGVRTNPQAVVSAHLTPQGYLQHFFHQETDKLADVFVNPLGEGKYEVEVKNIDMRETPLTNEVIKRLKAQNYNCQGLNCSKEIGENDIRWLAMFLSSLHQAYKLPPAQVPQAVDLAISKINAIPNDNTAYDKTVYPYTVEDWVKELGKAPAPPIKGLVQPPVPAGKTYPKLNWQYINALPKKGKPPWQVGGCVSFVSAGPTKIKLGYCAGVINEAIDSEGNTIPLKQIASLTSTVNEHHIVGDGDIIFDSKWNTLYITLPDELAKIKPLVEALEKSLEFVHTGETTWHKQATGYSAARVGYFFSQLHNITQLPEECWGDAVLYALNQISTSPFPVLKPVYPFKTEDWMKDICKIEEPVEEPPQPIDELIKKSNEEYVTLSKKIKDTPGMLAKAKETTAYKKMPKPVKDQIHAFLNNQLLFAEKEKKQYGIMLKEVQDFLFQDYPGLTKLMVKLQLDIEKKSKIRKGELPAEPGEIVEKTLENDSSAELKNEVMNELKAWYDSGTVDAFQLVAEIKEKFGLGASNYLINFVISWALGYSKQVDKSNEPVFYKNLPKDMKLLLHQAITEKAAEGKDISAITDEICEQFNIITTQSWQDIAWKEIEAYESLMAKKKVEQPSWEDLPPDKKEEYILEAYQWAKDSPEYEKTQIMAALESKYNFKFSKPLDSISEQVVASANALKKGLIDKAKYTTPWTSHTGWENVPLEIAACMGKAMNTKKPDSTVTGLYIPLIAPTSTGFTEEEITEWWNNCVEQYEHGLEEPEPKEVLHGQKLKDWLYGWLETFPALQASPEYFSEAIEGQDQFASPGLTEVKAALDELVQEGKILWNLSQGLYMFQEPGKPGKYAELEPTMQQQVKEHMKDYIDGGVGKIEAIKGIRTVYYLELDGLPELWNELTAEKAIEAEIPTIDQLMDSEPATAEEIEALAVHLMKQNKFSINEISLALANKYAVKDDEKLQLWLKKIYHHHKLPVQLGPKYEELDDAKKKEIIDYIVEQADYPEAEIIEFVYGTHGVMYSPALYDEIRKIQKGMEEEEPDLESWDDLTPEQKQAFAQKVKDEDITGWDELKQAAIESGIIPDEDTVPTVSDLKSWEEAGVTYLDYTDLTSETKENIAKSVANYIDAGMEEDNIYKQIAAEYNLSADEANEAMISGFISGYKIPEEEEELHEIGEESTEAKVNILNWAEKNATGSLDDWVVDVVHEFDLVPDEALEEFLKPIWFKKEGALKSMSELSEEAKVEIEDWMKANCIAEDPNGCALLIETEFGLKKEPDVVQWVEEILQEMEEEPEKLKKYSDLSHKDQLKVTADIKKAKQVGTTKTELVQYLLDAYGIFTDTPLDEYIDSIYEEKEPLLPEIAVVEFKEMLDNGVLWSKAVSEIASKYDMTVTSELDNWLLNKVKPVAIPKPKAPSPEQMETYDEMIKAYYQVGWTPAAVMEFFAGKIPSDQLKKTANKLYKIYKPEVVRITQQYDNISLPLQQHLEGVASKLLNEGKGIADVAWYISVNYGIEKESVKVMVRKIAQKPLEQVEAAVKAMQFLEVGEFIGGCRITEPMDKLNPQNVSYCQGILEKKGELEDSGDAVIHTMDNQEIEVFNHRADGKWKTEIQLATSGAALGSNKEMLQGVRDILNDMLKCHYPGGNEVTCELSGEDGEKLSIADQDKLRKTALFLSSIDNVALLDKACVPYALKHAMESAKKKNETSKPWTVNVYPKEVSDWQTIVCSKIME